jgi:hypothetical protein
MIASWVADNWQLAVSACPSTDSQLMNCPFKTHSHTLQVILDIS